MPATLINDRFRLEMSVSGYEFPDRLENPFDANWLVIRLALHMLHGAWYWQVEDAGALTWELDDCIHWLRQLSAGQAVPNQRCGFSEPDIQFETILNDLGNAVGLTVYLKDEFQPPTKVLAPRQANVVGLRFHTPPDVLQAFADSLLADLEQFPQRGARPK
jgi:hypothetical protein